MTTARVRSVDIRPGRNAVANQRAVCLSSLCVRPGRSQSGAVSFSATRCICVSIKMSLTMFVPKSVVKCQAIPPPPHGDKHGKEKGRGPDLSRAVLTATSSKHRWLYISRSTERHCTCQSGVWKREVGKAVRGLAHLRIALANVLNPWSTVYR